MRTGALEFLACIRARLYRLRKNSCFVSGRDFRRAVRTIENLTGFSPGFVYEEYGPIKQAVGTEFCKG